MDHLLQSMWGERSPTRVVGVYQKQASAEAVLERLRNSAGLGRAQVRLLRPQDASPSHRDLFGQSVEPESAGQARTLVRTHVLGGLAGGGLGVALYLWLAASDHPLIASSPLLAFVVIVGLAIAFGLLAGGLLALRPDHILLINQLRSALRENRWVVVAHPLDRAQTAKVKEVLKSTHAEVHSTL